VLALAVPTTRDAFVRDFQLAPAQDYVFQYAGRPLAVTHERIAAWFDGGYCREAAIVDDVVEAVRGHGVEVVFDLNLARLGSLCERFGVVTLVAHWKPAEVFWDDIRDPIALARQLREGNDPLIAIIRKRLSMDARRLISDPSNSVEGRANIQKALSKELTELLASEELGHIQPGGTSNSRTFRNREQLDSIFGSALAPGNRVEFADGLHRIQDVVSQVPEKFTGILELSVCNSIFLAEAIRRRCRQCRGIVANEEPTSTAFRLVLYKYVIKVIATSPTDYLDAIEDLRVALARRRKVS